MQASAEDLAACPGIGPTKVGFACECLTIVKSK